MQRWYSRIAGYRRLACVSCGGKSRPTLSLPFSNLNLIQHGSRFNASSNVRRAKKPLTASRQEEEKEGHAAYLEPEKQPPLEDRQHAHAWVEVLNRALPEYLRVDVQANGHGVGGRDMERNEGAHSGGSPPLTPRDVARILRRAQRAYNVDILTYMGMEMGRWKAVAWLVPYVVNDIWQDSEAKTKKMDSELPGPWKSRGSLVALTERDEGINLDLPTKETQQTPPPSLDVVTIEQSLLHNRLEATFDHETLGVIWTSLARMIHGDAARKHQPGSTITPEILEVIACLHHSGVMPSSIYSYHESGAPDGLRQPPTLHLLSSHILTSLTDAAWRAYESQTIQEAKKSNGGEDSSHRPGISASMYNVHVAGLGHEVWLELVLWSCLHGGWVEAGASILYDISRDFSWSALSWRELAAPFMKPGQEKRINWDDLRYRLNAGNAVTYGNPKHNQAVNTKVKRTISTEVVTAYVEGLLDRVRTSVGERGIPASKVFHFINAFRSFLDNIRCSLGSTSWDAVVLRFFESNGLDVQKEPALAERIVHQLAPEFGKEVSASNAPARNEQWQTVPAYVLDGTAAAMGLMHRVLRVYIQAGNLDGALRSFKELQRITDRNKQKSIEAFFARQALDQEEAVEDATQHVQERSHHSVDFASRTGGIEYPAFFPRIPTTILAPFLDLLTDTRSFDVGTWLLDSQDIDGPIISESLYADPIVGPAIVRFATALGDIDLLIKLLEAQGKADSASGSLPHTSIVALLQGQVNLKRWDTVDNILDKLSTIRGYPLDGQSVADLCAAIVRETDPMSGPVWQNHQAPDLDRAYKTFVRVTADAKHLNKRIFSRVRTAWMVLGQIDERWETMISSLWATVSGGQPYAMTPRAFNTVLEAVVTTYGSHRGTLFLARFWKSASRHREPATRPASDTLPAAELPDYTPPPRQELISGVKRMPRQRPGAVHKPGTCDISIYIGRKVPERPRGRLFGVFLPNAITVQVVLRQALKEHFDDKWLWNQDLAWAWRLLRSLDMPDADIKTEIDRTIWRVRNSRNDERGL